MKALRLPLFLFAFAAVSGLLRWIDTYRVIPATAIRFAHLHDVTWDEYGKRVSRTGSDPYLVFDLPPDTVPIRWVTVHFVGPYVEAEGTFYVFQSNGPVVSARVRPEELTFQVAAKLDRSTDLRLDLPDFLPRSLQIDRVVIRKPFADWSVWPFRLASLGFVAALASLLLCLRHRTRAS